MADERRPAGQPYELFGEVMLGPRQGVDTEYDGLDNPTEGQEIARQSVPLVRQTDEERRREQQQMEDEAPGLIEGIDLATQQEWIPRLMGNKEFTPDPDFEMSADVLEKRAEGLPEDAFDYIAKAQSQEEADYLERKYRKDYEREQELAKMGWSGVGLRVGAALTDPAAWGIGAAASAAFGPAGLVGTAAKNLSRAGRIIRSGTAGAAGNLAVEAAISQNKPIYDNMNLLYAAGLGFGIGGGMSAISRNPSTQAEAEGLRKAGEGLKREAEERVGQMIRDAQFSPSQAGPGDAGAAAVSREIPIRDDDISIDSFLTAVDKDPSIAPRAAFSKGRFSSMSMGLSSENPATRAIFKPLAEEGVGYTDRNAAVIHSASEGQRMREMQVTNEWMRGWQPNFREWVKAEGQGNRWKPFYNEEMAKVFNEQVTDYVEGLTTDVHPAVARQGDVMRKILDDFRRDLNQPMAYRQEYGRPVKGFGTLEEDPFYVPREFDLGKVRSLVREFGTTNIETLIARSIKNAADDITDEAAQKAGRAYLKTIRSMDAGMGGDTARILSSGDGEEIKAFLKNNVDGDSLSEADIDDIVDSLTVRKSEGGQKHGKSRTPLETGFSMNLRRNPEYGQGSREVSVRELFNRDAHDLMAGYTRKMSGALAMARYRIPGLSDGITSHGEWETLLNKARDIGYRQGMDPKEMNRELAEADRMYRAIMGMPNEADLTKWGQSLKFFRDWSFMRFMGQVGFAQIPEAGVAAAGLGIKTMFKGVPGFKGFIRDAQTGKIDHELIDEIEIATGYGGDWLRSGQLDRFNDMTGSRDTILNQGWKDRLEFTVRKSKRAVFAGSGMAAVNTVLKRSVANGIAQRFAEAAWGTGKLMNKNRLRSIGLTDAQVDGILENIRNHAEWEEGLTGRKLKRLNLNQWDLASEANFTESMFRYANRLVQENDIGQFRQWMAHPVARMFLQFRSFIIGAHEKQFLHNLHMRDFQAFSTFAATTFMSTLGYTAMTYSRSVGKGNQEEYLKERLSTANLAKASFERSSWSGLVPTAVDTVFPGTFSYRSSGQATGAIFGNPTADTLNSTHTALQTILSGDLSRSQEDVQNLTRLMPFQNLNGVTQLSNSVLGEMGLPEDAPRE